ncbi:MAG: diphosphomevalonate decarboxylase [Chloroflexaceae bacterium]|nr:diphosphomevalonate decarboxylase [Chloroflexaceae bacterium]
MQHLDRIRALAGIPTRARVDSTNTFPADAGIASSAAGFAALTLAAVAAAGLHLDTYELSRLARRSGSGSASRSVPTGYVEWYNGDDVGSYAESIAAPDHWHLANIVAVVDTSVKKVGSAENHRLAVTSPYFQTRLDELPARLDAVREAIAQRDIARLGPLIEVDAISMHAVCMTQVPPSFYWNAATMAVMEAVRTWREQGVQAYYTMDAGANVHVICEGHQRDEVNRLLQALPIVQFTIANNVGPGARVLDSAALVTDTN